MAITKSKFSSLITQTQSELAGKSLPIIDGQIAATSIYHNLIIATKNVSDMQISKGTLYNPWEDN